MTKSLDFFDRNDFLVYQQFPATNIFSSSLPWMFASSSSNLHGTAGIPRLCLAAIFLRAGTVINSISMVASSAPSGGTNFWVALYDKNFNLLQSSTDNAGALPATSNTLYVTSLSASYTVPVSDVYYAGSFIRATSAGTHFTSATYGAPVYRANPALSLTTPLMTNLNTAPSTATPLNYYTTGYPYVGVGS